MTVRMKKQLLRGVPAFQAFQSLLLQDLMVLAIGWCWQLLGVGNLATVEVIQKWVENVILDYNTECDVVVEQGQSGVVTAGLGI